MNRQNWRILNKTLSTKMFYMYKKEIHTDVTLSVSNNENVKEFKVHQVVLIGSSEVFEKALTDDFIEKSTKLIKINDVDFKIFELFLTYLYTYDINLHLCSEAIEVYKLADKYMILPLKDVCLKCIERNINSATACSVFEFAQLYGFEGLESRCLRAMQKNTLMVISNPNFLCANIKTLAAILNEDSLNIEKEITLFTHIAKWIQNNFSKKDEDYAYVCQEMLPKIRYLSMSPEEFITGPVKSGLFKKDQWGAILANIVEENSVPYPNGFTKTRRNLTAASKLAVSKATARKVATSIGTPKQNSNRSSVTHSLPCKYGCCR